MKRREFLSTGALALGGAWAQQTTPPNVILIYCDDLGYGDLGCYGSPLRTPHIDRMAAEGMRFTSCITANPVCSPSRAGLMTGRYPTRVGVPRVFFPQDQEGLHLDETTLAQALKGRGYRTACIGKWHLGHQPRYLPTARGFDSYYGIPYSNDMKPPVLMRNTEVIEQEANQPLLTPRYTEEALKFIDGAKDGPFFLYLAHTFPHIPLFASERFRGKSPFGIYGDVLEELDWSTGELMARIRKLGLERRTLILFSSDNGPWFLGSPGRLRGRKGSTYEGGVRVPFIAWWPGHIPNNRVSRASVSTMDLFPTVCALAGARLPDKPLDGVNIWPLLSGREETLEREALLYFDNWNLQCARLGQWKLHLARYNTPPYVAAPPGGRVNLMLERPELYDVDNDPDESYDAAPENRAVVEQIRARVEKLLTGFPEPVQKAWAETKARRVLPHSTAAYPRPA